jgi:hypothetical protein
VTREDIPTVRDNGCWTVDGEYVGWGRNIFMPYNKTLYCFCDERDGCNQAPTAHRPIQALAFASLIFISLVYMALTR